MWTGAGEALDASIVITGDTKSTGLRKSYPFPHPPPQYQRLLTVASRPIQYAWTAVVRGDLSAADEILASLEPGSWPLIRRQVGLDRRISEGLRRGAGLDPLDLDALSSEQGALHTAVYAAFRSLTIAD